jgi:cytochrome c peroxidase
MLRSVVPFVACSVVAAFTSGCDRGDSQPPRPSVSSVSKPSGAPSATAQVVSKGPTFEPPKSLGKPRVPKDNEFSPEKAELGRMLFFDKRLSADGSRSCYSCHLNEDGTGGHLPTAIGAGDKPLPRHSPVLWNIAYLPRLYWDGRAESLEAMAKGAWAGPNLGVVAEAQEAKAKELGAIPGYQDAFARAFPGEGATPENIVKAIATYERTLYCGATAFDRFDAGEASALNDEQKAGWKLFTGKAACNQCHVPPFFSDAFAAEQGVYHNVGIGIEGKRKEDVDPGRSAISKNPSEWAAFKTPSLRNVSKTPPYFHDGSIAKFEDAVRFMAGGGFPNENRDPRLTDRKLGDAEIAQLVAFLGSLECDGVLEEPKLP